PALLFSTLSLHAALPIWAALIHAFDWMFYVFGAILLLSAARMLKSEEEQFDPSKSVLVRIARRVYPVTDRLDGERFFTIEQGRRSEEHTSELQSRENLVC